MGVVANGKGELAKVHVSENRELEKLTRPGFPRQFEGRKTVDARKVGGDINASGALAKAAQAAAPGAQRGLLTDEMFRER